MINKYSLYKIDDDQTFEFNINLYSKFKYGDGDAAKLMGEQLSMGFINNLLSTISLDQQIVVISSPFAHIPTATFALKVHFVNVLNQWLIHNGYNVVEETKIYRWVTYKDDYGALNAEQRLSLIGNDQFHIDKKFVQGKLLIFLDDVRITGSHETMIMKMLQNANVDEHQIYVYFAELTKMTIDPSIENVLNYAYVKTDADILSILKNANFIPNTRVVKHILCMPTHRFLEILKELEPRLCEEIYYLAIGNAYHSFEEYKYNLEFLRKSTQPNSL